MGLKLGLADITKAYLGSTSVSAIYVGSTQVWGGAPAVPGAPTLTVLSAPNANPIDLKITPVDFQTGDKFPIRISKFADFSDLPTGDLDFLDPGSIGGSAIYTSIEAPTAGTWYLSVGRLRGTDLVWSDPPVSVTTLSGYGTAPAISSVTINNTAPFPGDLLSVVVVATGVPAPTLAYNWKAGASTVATTAEYEVKTDDGGKAITCTVTADNGIGTPAILTSAATDPVPVVSPWSPLDLAITVGFWLDPQDLATMKQEITGASATTAVVVDSPVGSMLDKATGLWFVAPSTSARPILRKIAGGRYYLQFDGVDDILFAVISPTNNLYTAAHASVFLSASMAGSSSDRRIVALGRSTDTAPVYAPLQTHISDATKLLSWARTDANTIVIQSSSHYGLVTPTTRKTIGMTDSGALVTGYDSGVATTPTLAYTRTTALTLDRMAIGGYMRTAPAGFVAMNFFGGAALNRVLTSTEIANLNTYLSA